MTTILDIIARIKNNSNYKNPTYTFTNGKCLSFAKQLYKVIGGQILFLPEYFHFVCEYDGNYYDATGRVTKKYKYSEKIPLKNLEEKRLKGYV